MRKFNTESESISYFIGWLEQRGFTDIDPTQGKDKYCYYDIDAVKDNKRYRFELKVRDMSSTRYGDAICEQHKYNEFMAHRDEYDAALLVSFYRDCFTLSNIKNWVRTERKWANKTTDFSNNEMILKDFMIYKQEKKIEYD